MLRRKPPAEDPAAGLRGGWADAVHRARASQARFDELVSGNARAPFAGRLGELSALVAEGVADLTAVARRGQQAADLAAGVDLRRVTDEFKDAKRALTGGTEDPVLRARFDALEARHAAAHRLRNGIDDAAERLATIEAQLEAVVWRAASVIVSGDAIDPLASDLRRVTDELAAMNAALAELGDRSRCTGAGSSALMHRE